MQLLKVPFILVLWLVTFVDATVHNLYFNWTGTFLGTASAAGGVGIPGNWIMPVMSIGQIAEILTMLVLGVTLKRLGWRTTMIVGILGHAARFAVFAFLPQYQALVILINVLHGIAYAFFFATVYIFVDEFFPKDARASAQGLFNLMILGFGPLVANFIGPQLMARRSAAAASWTSGACSWSRSPPPSAPPSSWRSSSTRRRRSSRSSPAGRRRCTDVGVRSQESGVRSQETEYRASPVSSRVSRATESPYI